MVTDHRDPKQSFLDAAWFELKPYYLVLSKTKDREKAKKCLYLGIILGIIGIIVNLLFLTSEIPIEEQFGVNVAKFVKSSIPNGFFDFMRKCSTPSIDQTIYE